MEKSRQYFHWVFIKTDYMKAINEKIWPLMKALINSWGGMRAKKQVNDKPF